jgi:hypothetical protein
MLQLVSKFIKQKYPTNKLKEDQEFAQTKKSLLISHLIFESMQKLTKMIHYSFIF